jgi:hypothetical protein
MSTIMTRSGLILATLVGTLVAGCSEEPDVGQPCPLPVTLADGSLADACNGKGDYLGEGATVCENLVCVLTGATSDICASRTPICSKPCVSDSDCFKKKTGLECRPVVLDEETMQTWDPVLRQKYLSDIGFSNYCAYPKSHQ